MENSAQKNYNTMASRDRKQTTSAKVIPLFKENATKGINLDSNINSKISNTINNSSVTIPSGYSIKLTIEPDNDHMIFNTSNFYHLNNQFHRILPVTFEKYKPYDIVKFTKETQEIEEVIKVEKRKIFDILMEQINFLLLSLFTVIFSLAGMAIYYTVGFYFIHPLTYLVVLLMGIGWSATAIVSIKCTKVDMYGRK